MSSGFYLFGKGCCWVWGRLTAHCLPLTSQLFHSPLSIIVLPSKVTVQPPKCPPRPNVALLSPPAQVLLPVPSDTMPAWTQLPSLLVGHSFKLGLMPKST